MLAKERESSAPINAEALLSTLKAFKRGDFHVRMRAPRVGIAGEVASTLNEILEQNDRLTRELLRMSRVVGKEGKIGARASIGNVTGDWATCLDSVNSLIGDLARPTTEVARVIGAVAKGDLSQSIPLEIDGRPAKGEFLRTARLVNTMVDQLNSFASEVTRVAREVGTEGKLGGQAEVKGVAGTWKDLTDNVNYMAGNLTSQVRNIAQVTTAVANGDLSKKITVEARGEILELKNTINVMVDQLNSFASEVTRVAREVGTEGKLGGQAVVKGVAGTWKDLTDNVNYMASNLTSQVRNIAQVTTAVATGDLSKKITVDVRGEILELKNTINTMVDQLNSFASEVTRVAREVGTEGKLGGQAMVKGVGGTWKDLTDNVNYMAGNLTSQVRNIAQVTTAVANGDLSKKITVEVKGEILELKNTINTMVDQLNSFASEVTRVAREVGTEGKLGGQAVVQGVAGTWKDLTDNVNSMASNLTSQVRGIAKVVTAVASGDLKRKLTVETKGEIAALADTINDMIDTLATFADQVTTVAREVGTEGKLGGQAKVPGAAGLWKDLTDNVNQLAANLTNQVRAIAEVATAVTKGDLTRSIAVEALGEVAALKDNINEMIRNLKDTTQKNTEQDWLKTNLALMTNKMQGQKNLTTVSNLILSELTPLVNAHHGAFYMNEAAEGLPVMRLLGSYAYKERKGVATSFRAGEGLVGQCALEKERILVTNAPSDYIQITSGLGSAPPYNIVVLPVLFEGEVKAVIELASFNRYSEIHLTFLDQLKQTIGIVLNTIAANMRTEDLLKQSQALTAELQAQQHELKSTNERLERQAETLRKSEELLRTQQEELRQKNEQLEEKANLLSQQNTQVETKNREVEDARRALEEKASQLAVSSKYKSEFLANMSHELRTPLNSLLILSKLLSDNREETLSPKQVEFARTIYASGSDLLALINDILDLAKIESGTMGVSISSVGFAELTEFVDRTFREVAQNKGLAFEVERVSGLPVAIQTDSLRLQQVLKNLISNAIKFTAQGSVTLRIEKVVSGWDSSHTVLNQADAVLAFSVTDTGIGIPAEKQQIIFEAFQQADGTTSRKYGGTGLGLSISREIARLLGGEIQVRSVIGKGSTFTFYLPRVCSTILPRSTQPALATKEAFRDHVATPEFRAPVIAAAEVPDDRSAIEGGERVLLIIEDDAAFAQILLDLAHEKGFKGLVATTGETGLGLARRFKPTAMTLDLCLPDKDGWAILDRLKHDPVTRHIPVHIISVEEARQRGLRQGAFGYLSKPVDRGWLERAFDDMVSFIDRPSKNLLVVEDNEDQRRSIIELIGGGDVQTTAVGSGTDALNALQKGSFDCMVLDLRLPDMSGQQLIEAIHDRFGHRNLPIIVYTGMELSRKEESELKLLTEAIIIKDVRSPERLLDETALFLHRASDALAVSQREMIEQVHQTDPALAGRRVLIVDDDIRNIFALTSILEQHDMEVLHAENGQEGIAALRETPDIDVMLMDVMMPDMDGYQTMHAIRKMPEFASLPIIAVTAKAMKTDRAKCIEAGASDYISKPVDPELLLSLLRVWLYR